MSILEAIVLGLVQGVTEFLPISSSAHLVLVPYLVGWQDGGLSFAVVTNAATLLAAVINFRHSLVPRRPWLMADAWLHPGLARAVLIASLPALVAGGMLYRWLAQAARGPGVIAATTIGFGLLLWWADRSHRPRRRLAELSWRDGVLIGLAQALALVPGTSRSGITITAGLMLGYSRQEAARFSFLLAIPVGLMALVRDLGAVVSGEAASAPWPPLLIGFAVAGASAYAVIGWLLRWLERQSLFLFVLYRLLVGGLLVAFLALH